MTTTIANFLLTLLLLLFINVLKSYEELNYDLHRYDMHQQSNIPFSTRPNIKIRPGFRLKTGIADHQRAELSWLAANTEPRSKNFVEIPRARPLLHLATTKQPEVVVSPASHINYQQHYAQQQPQMISTTNYINYHNQHPYYQKLPVNYHTFPSLYYASNFRTIPPVYYNNYLSPTFIQPPHLPLSTMMSAIRGILSIVQKTIHPNSTRNIDFQTIRGNDILEESNLINSSKQLSSSSLLSSLLPSSSSSSSSSLSSSLSSLSSSLSLSSTPIPSSIVTDEIVITSISGTDNDNEKEQLMMNVERMIGASIRQIKEKSKLIELTSHEIGKIDDNNNNSENIITTIAAITTTTTTATTTRIITTTIPSAKTTTTTSSIDDGSNLLGSLLSGRLDKIDWFGSLFGMNHLPSKEEGSAMAQIFDGGIFGPAS